MRFQLQQRFWSLGDDFIIRDGDGIDRYQVDGRAFSFGNKLSFQDMAGHQLAFIRQRLLAWGEAYEIERPGETPTSVKKEHFTFFTCKFAADGPGTNDYEASGDFLDHEYEIRNQHGVVATISKRWFSWTDSYGVEVAEGADVVMLLAIAVVIDLVCHDKKAK